MTDEQAQELLNKLIEEFGDLLPNPEHYPRTFDYYLKIYEHNKPRTNHH